VKVAQKLLGVPTIGGRSAWAGGWRRELKEANKPSSWPKYTKTALKTSGLPTLIDLKIAENTIFCSKYFIRYSSQMFLRNTLILKFWLLKALWSYFCLMFRSQIHPQPSRLGFPSETRPTYSVDYINALGSGTNFICKMSDNRQK
jgi:hypothetical protein